MRGVVDLVERSGDVQAPEIEVAREGVAAGDGHLRPGLPREELQRRGCEVVEVAVDEGTGLLLLELGRRERGARLRDGEGTESAAALRAGAAAARPARDRAGSPAADLAGHRTETWRSRGFAPPWTPGSPSGRGPSWPPLWELAPPRLSTAVAPGSGREWGRGKDDSHRVRACGPSWPPLWELARPRLSTAVAPGSGRERGRGTDAPPRLSTGPWIRKGVEEGDG